MLLKLIALIAAVVPIFLFVRSVFFRGRPTRFGTAMKEFNKQLDFATWIFLGLVGCLVAFGIAKLLLSWWSV